MPRGIGMRIKVLRRAKGWTQTELGERVGVKRVAIARIESPDTAPNHRSPSLKLLERLARVFKVSVGELLGEKRKPR
jgi:transcriptional regulator with XRE-family HTH domain